MTTIERVERRCAEAIDTIEAGTYSEPRGSLRAREHKQYWPLGTRGVDGRRRNGRVVRSWKRGAE